MKSQILNKRDIDQKLLRIAYQIAEEHFDETELVFVGIYPKGQIIAEVLQRNLSVILPHIKTSVEHIEINKEAPLSTPIKTSFNESKIAGKTIILVDDVINSGKTAFYGFQPFMSIPIKKIKTAVLVDRKHKNFPVTSDYVGLSLSTTLLDLISVEIVDGKIEGAYLM